MAILEETQGEPIICEQCEQPMQWNEELCIWRCPRDGSIGRKYVIEAGGGRLNVRAQQAKAGA
jgi:ribosomal protein L37AE/L43A